MSTSSKKLPEADAAVNGNTQTLRTVSDGTASPRVSTVGDDEQAVKKERQAYGHGADYTAPGLDSLHWAGVKKRGDFDQRSVASSMNAERDDKSVHEDHAVGAVEEADEHYDEEAPEEIVLALGAVQSEGDLGTEPLGSAPSGPRAQGKLGGELAAEAAGASAGTPPLRRGPASVAFSTDADNGSLRPTSEDGELQMEDVALEGGGGAGGGHVRASSAPRDIAGHAAASGAPPPLDASIATSSAAASPRSPTLASSPLDARGAAEAAVAREPAAGPLLREHPAGGEGSDAPKPAPGGSGGGQAPVYQSRLMQGLASGEMESEEGRPAGASAEEEDKATTYSSSATSASPSNGGSAAVEPAAAPAAPRDPAAQGEPAAPAAAAPDEDGPGPSKPAAAANGAPPAAAPAMQPFQVEGGAPAGARPAPASPPVPLPQHPVPRVVLPPQWESSFRGVLYTDGIDALGRPVAVVNADAVPPGLTQSALVYVRARLEPVVNAGQYVIVFTSRKAKLPTLWIMGAYQSLPRPYRKNVQYIVLVRPSAFFKAVLAFMRPFVSRKAAKKIKIVESLSELSGATGGEVGIPHLGQLFLDDDAAAEDAEMAAAQGP